MSELDAVLLMQSLDDPSRFVGIFDRHYDRIARYLRRRLPREDAEDAASEVFTTAFRSRARFDRRLGDVDAWLFGIATMLIRSHARSERKRLEALARAQDRAERFSPGLADSTDDRVARALLELSAGERDVVFLIACADLSYEAVASALEIPIGTVRSRYSRARAALREQLGLRGVDSKEVSHG